LARRRRQPPQLGSGRLDPPGQGPLHPENRLMTAGRTYLDHNATSPLRPAARAAILAALDLGGNASSVHAEGRAARALIDEARETLARALGVIPPMVIFTSGGSEANNLAIKGAPVDRLLVSATEHPSVIEAAKASGR